MRQSMQLESEGNQLPGTTAGKTLQGIRGGNARNARARGRKVVYAAHGGEVEHYCELKIPHEPDCQYFMNGGVAMYADGGPVEKPFIPPNPATVLGHSAAHHGLLAMIKDVGNVSGEQEKHHKTMNKAMEHFSSKNHEKAASTIHGTPLAGSVGKNDLAELIPYLSDQVASGESSPQGLRAAVDYLHSAVKGHRKLEDHFGKLFGTTKSSDRIKPDDGSREELKDFLEHANEYPQGLLDVGGSIGHYLPEHSTQLGALAATAVNHFNSLRPPTPQQAPLDEPTEPDEMATQNYERQLDVAQNPMLIVQHMRDGTLMPQDLETLGTLYPGLAKSMQDKAGEALISAKAKKMEIPYHQAQSLSLLLGQPLDSTMTPSSMQAIIASAAPQQASNQQMGKKKSQNKPTAAVLKQFDKVDSLYETPNESRQIDRKS